MIEEFKSIAHGKTKLRYHIIFSTKYRKHCLSDIKQSVLDSFKYAEEKSNFKILLMNLESNHIHFLMTWKPSLSIEQVIRRMKQLSNYYLWNNCEDYLKQFYWNKKKIWTGGYFISTIGNVSEKNLIEYIEKQG